MSETNKADIETFIEDDQEQTTAERYDQAGYLLAEVLGCGSADVAAILDMLRTHDDLIEVTREYITDADTEWSFGAFVSGIERLVLNEISDRISEDLYQALCEVQIDDNYVAWGGVASTGDIPFPVAEVFAEMCMEGVTDERVEELIKTDREIAEGTKRAEATQAEMRRNGEIED